MLTRYKTPKCTKRGRRRRRLSGLLVIKRIYIIILYVTIILLILFGIYITILLNGNETDSHTLSILKKYQSMDMYHHPSRQHRWIKFGAYQALPFFYVKTGYINTAMTETNENLLSIATFCDLNLLQSAREIVLNYQSGPISIAIYINKDYHSHDIHSFTELKELFQQTFADLHNSYNIIIGLLYHDETSAFYIKKGFTESTPMMFKLPNNALRNLAEHQVTTKWLLNIDIDFIYFSDSFSSRKLAMTLKQLNDITNKPEIGDKTILIVPSFEVLREEYDSIDGSKRYQSLSKKQLIEYTKTEDENLQTPEIAPFHASMNAQKCTNYTEWYTRNQSEFSYFIHYKNERSCSWHYEPWYIINTKISRLNEYSWDNTFVGRGLNKVERTFTLKHHCFNFYVLNDLFIIHKPDSLHWDGINKNHTKITASDTEQWHLNNRLLFDKKRRKYFRDKKSCAFYLKRYFWFWTTRSW